MGLIDLWHRAPWQLEGKHVAQIIAFAGGGRLADGSVACQEFRAYLDQIPSAMLARYANECLEDRFADAGLALQDVVNAVGERLGFGVEPGLYRGRVNAVGHDGLWRTPDGHSIVLEVKTSDTYRIELGKLDTYRRALAERGLIDEDRSSILLVVGRQQTDDLEAQIRGSRHAWDTRLIGLDALLRLVLLREGMDDPNVVHRMRAILIPREFTKLDEIVNVLFLSTEEARPDDVGPPPPLPPPRPQPPAEPEPEAVAPDAPEPQPQPEAAAPEEPEPEAVAPEPDPRPAATQPVAPEPEPPPVAAEQVATDSGPEVTPEASSRFSAMGWPGLQQRYSARVFHDNCVAQLEHHLGRMLIKRSKTGYATADQGMAVSCLVSRPHFKADQVEFWFAFHPHQQHFLQGYPEGYVALGCGTQAYLLLVPLEEFEPWLGECTPRVDGRSYWHVRIHADEDAFVLYRGRDKPSVDMTRYLLPLWGWL